MRKAFVYYNGQKSGELIQHSTNDYEFKYEDLWFQNENLPAISLTLPKNQKIYKSNVLFPFFFNMLSEGVNKQLQCRQYKIDDNDYFGLLLATAQNDTIGAISIIPV